MSEQLRAVARGAYEKHGMGEEALKEVEEYIRKNEDLFNDAIRLAAKEVLGAAQHMARQRIVAPAAFVPKKYSKEFQQSVQYACGKFFNWPLMDGTKLGEARKEHLLRDAARFQINAQANAKNARFLEMIAAKLPEDKTVREVFSEEQLRVFMNKARREVEEG